MNTTKQTLQVGIDTFGDTQTTLTGEPVTPAQTIRNIVEQATLADELHIDAFGVGEHHRADYAVSSPETILAGIATKTRHIKLGSAVTVLSSDDPVRVYQRFATLQALSSGRAEIMAGRGSFIESFPLFGYSLTDYETLYEEKLQLLTEILKQQPVTWEGSTRSPLKNQDIHPATEQSIPLWVAVGGTPTSVIRAAVYNLPVAFAIIGGPAQRFKSLTETYTQLIRQNTPEAEPQIAVHSMGHVSETDQKAQEEFYPYYEKFHNRLGAERGWGKLTPTAYLNEIQNGSLYVGSPQTVATKIRNTVSTLNATRFDLKYATGHMPHETLMNSIKLFGEQVVPELKQTI